MSLKQKIYKALDEGKYLTDSDIAKMYDGEPNWATVEEYKRSWKALQRDREFFANKKIVGLIKPQKTRALAETPEGSYLITKDYFNEIVGNFVPDNSRPDLKIGMYKLPVENPNKD